MVIGPADNRGIRVRHQCVAGFGGLSNNHSNQLQKAIARVEQIHVVVEDLQQISLRVMDLEANQPGYDAPGDESPRHTGQAQRPLRNS